MMGCIMLSWFSGLPSALGSFARGAQLPLVLLAAVSACRENKEPPAAGSAFAAEPAPSTPGVKVVTRASFLATLQPETLPVWTVEQQSDAELLRSAKAAGLFKVM